MADIIAMVQQKAERNGKMMIDIHCHILPHIDDGAENENEAKVMLDMERSAGVDAMYLTPHFYPEKIDIDTFLRKRECAWEKLSAADAVSEQCQIRLGAEVRYSEQLLSMDLKRLTLGDSDYLLLELPENRYPAYVTQLVEYMQGRGVVPIFAHIERYAYFRKEPKLIKHLVEMGALAQVNMHSLFDRRDRNFSLACLKHGMAQLIASDAHNTTSRRPCMELTQKLPTELIELHNVFAKAIWENDVPVYYRPTLVKKSLFGYR